MRMDERHELDVKEVMCLRSMSGLTRMSRWRNEGVRRRVRVTESEKMSI